MTSGVASEWNLVPCCGHTRTHFLVMPRSRAVIAALAALLATAWRLQCGGGLRALWPPASLLLVAQLMLTAFLALNALFSDREYLDRISACLYKTDPSGTTVIHCVSVFDADGAASVDEIVAQFRRSVVEPFARMRQRIHPGSWYWWFPYWEDAHDFCLEDHITRHASQHDHDSLQVRALQDALLRC